ncbi:bifunctional 3'-5' exonuclease/DNA polymerase [Galactobacter valiniphilus]|uniref:bifunctional 3'-5' exonuclease/DNA polymerase n=1 Tax=Galactobacter valiniphilus TaxID=2676122 RepID=UPI0037363E91
MTAYLLAPLAGEALAQPRGVVVPLDAAGRPTGPGTQAPRAELASVVAGIEAADPAARWVWEDSRFAYPELLEAGVEVRRCHDLGLTALLLHGAIDYVPTPGLPPRKLPELPSEASATEQDALFSALTPDPPAPQALAEEYAAQLEAIASAGARGRKLHLLASLDSAGSLIAEEMRRDGVPWDRAEHERLLAERLGPRVPHSTRPAKLADLTEVLQDLLDAPRLNPDSQPELLRALRGAGLDAHSTRRWDLEELHHPAIEPLLRYKKLQRLLTANGWAWLDAWVRGTRFHPEYVVAGVVTGRWASQGGGAMQIPHDVRSAVRADPGYVLVVADASQLEPRVLAAMSADHALAEAARGRDLYQSIADKVFGGDREMAKVAMLGAMYGGTTGPSAAMAPRLAAAYPRATALLEEAARTGERGGTVHTWLGRTSPRPAPFGGGTGGGFGPDGPGPGDEAPDAVGPGSRGAGTQAHTGGSGTLGGQGNPQSPSQDGAPRAAGDPAAAARAWGRFTRNFVVQGTAAEWAECWMADLRSRLRATAPGSRQVFFLHDEIMVHAPESEAVDVEIALRAAADGAARLIFGDIPVDFPISVGIARDYATAK